jgi:hypothetical protein
MGACNIPLGRYFQDISSGTLKAPNFKKLQLVNQKTNLNSFSDCISWWSKEPQWENYCGSFLRCCLLVIVHPNLNCTPCLTNTKDTRPRLLYTCSNQYIKGCCTSRHNNVIHHMIHKFFNSTRI